MTEKIVIGKETRARTTENERCVTYYETGTGDAEQSYVADPETLKTGVINMDEIGANDYVETDFDAKISINEDHDAIDWSSDIEDSVQQFVDRTVLSEHEARVLLYNEYGLPRQIIGDVLHLKTERVSEIIEDIREKNERARVTRELEIDISHNQ